MPGGIDALRICIDNDFGEHCGMVAVAATAGAGSVKDGVARADSRRR
nr:hypothetical protein [Paenibacillus albidus]